MNRHTMHYIRPVEEYERDDEPAESPVGQALGMLIQAVGLMLITAVGVFTVFISLVWVLW